APAYSRSVARSSEVSAPACRAGSAGTVVLRPSCHARTSKPRVMRLARETRVIVTPQRRVYRRRESLSDVVAHICECFSGEAVAALHNRSVHRQRRGVIYASTSLTWLRLARRILRTTQ